MNIRAAFLFRNFASIFAVLGGCNEARAIAAEDDDIGTASAVCDTPDVCSFSTLLLAVVRPTI